MAPVPHRQVKLIVFLVVLLDVIGIGIILPIQPFLAREYGASAPVITTLGAVYSAMQLLFAPVWGGWSDRIGRKPVLLFSIVVTALGHTAFAAATSLSGLFLARAVSGIGSANIATAQAVISDSTDEKNRGASMALIGAAFGLGFIIGPALGGALGAVHQAAPAVVAAAFSIVNLVFVVVRLPETRSLTEGQNRQHGSFSAYLRQPASVKAVILTTCFTIIAFATMEQGLGLLIDVTWANLSPEQRLEEGSRLLSSYLVVVGISAVIVQGFLVRKLFSRVSEAVCIPYSLGVLGVALLSIPLLALTKSFPVFCVSGVLLAIGSGVYNPAALSLVSKLAPSGQQGLSLALNQSAASLGRIIGPAIAGALFLCHPSAPFCVAALIVATAGALFFTRLSPGCLTAVAQGSPTTPHSESPGPQEAKGKASI
jgi:DHA1 family tetracycline resistance protein-like MFS transporter